MKHKKIFIFFLLWPLLAAWVSFTYKVNAFISPLLFFGIPSILLSVLKKTYVKKSFFATLLMFPFAIIADYIAEKTRAWVWPLPHSVFPFKIFTYVPVESVIWAFLQIYFVVIFFQFFFGKAMIKSPKRTKSAIYAAISIIFAFLIALFFFPNFLNIPYWYFIFGCIFLVPVILEDLRYPKVFSRISHVLLYFFYVNFSYEITALKLGWWAFPIKEYIGHVSFLGVTFPFEEFFFWILLSALVILSYYEYFLNNER